MERDQSKAKAERTRCRNCVDVFNVEWVTPREHSGTGVSIAADNSGMDWPLRIKSRYAGMSAFDALADMSSVSVGGSLAP